MLKALRRAKVLQSEREAAYGRVFQAIVDEQAALAALYAPLMARLAPRREHSASSASSSRVSSISKLGAAKRKSI